MSAEERNVEYQREFNDTALRAIVAYANTDGGRIYVGVDEFGRTYGVTNASEIAERIVRLARDRVRPDASGLVDCRVETRDGREVVVANVLRGDSRPYWLAEKGLSPLGAPVAKNGRAVAPTSRKLRALLAESGAGVYERERSLNQNLTFEQAAKVFEEEKLTLSERSFYDLGIVDAEGTSTNLALLLSDQCPATIRLAFFEGARENQLHDRLELSGSILRQYRDAFDFLDQYNRANDTLRAANRGDSHDYPPEILREALVNALIHRDYRLETRTLVRHYHNRVEIVSPGGLPRGVAPSELNLGVCAPRNPRLAHIFYLLEYAELCGSGVRKIRQAYAASPSLAKFEPSPNFFRTTLYNASSQRAARRALKVAAKPRPAVVEPPRRAVPERVPEPAVKEPEPALKLKAALPLKPVVVTPAEPPKAPAPTVAATTRRVTTIRDALTVASPTLAAPVTTVQTLSERERQILRTLAARGTITRGDVERELNLTQAASAAILRRLVNAGQVVLCGAGSNIWYRLP